MFLVAGGFIYSGGFLGIAGYGYGWDKTRWGLLVLLAALALYVIRHVVQDKEPMKLREEVPATPEEERRHPGPGARARRRWSERSRDELGGALSGPRRHSARRFQRGSWAIAAR